MRRAFVHLVCLACVLPVAACTYDVWSWEKCDLDPESCSQGYGWHLVASCDRSDPLHVELGQGDTTFQPLAPGEKPVLYHASGFQGQGSSHVFVGLRVTDPTPGHARYRVQIRACSQREGELSPSTPPSTPPCIGHVTDRNAIVGTSLDVAADGSLSRAGLQLFVDGPPSWLALEVEDECGRKGSDLRQF